MIIFSAKRKAKEANARTHIYAEAAKSNDENVTEGKKMNVKKYLD